MADEVVAGGEIRRDLARPLERLHVENKNVSNQDFLDRRLMKTSVTYINNNGGAPAIPAQRRRVHAHLVDLEPVLALAVTGREGTGTLVHPDHDRPLLVCPLGPNSCDVLAGRDVGGERR